MKYSKSCRKSSRVFITNALVEPLFSSITTRTTVIAWPRLSLSQLRVRYPRRRDLDNGLGASQSQIVHFPMREFYIVEKQVGNAGWEQNHQSVPVQD
jgi:hypothetical protein